MSTPAPRPLSAGARLALYAFTALGLIGGWMILLMGGFHSRVQRHPVATVWVDGPMAGVMVVLEFVMTAIGVAAILQADGASARWQVAGAVVTLGVPLLWVLRVLWVNGA